MKTLSQLIFIIIVAAITTTVRAQDTIIKDKGDQVLAFGEPQVIDSYPDWVKNDRKGWLIADVTGEYSYPNDMIVFPDGRIVLIGYSRLSQGPLPQTAWTPPTLIGVTKAGQIDTSFGEQGIVITHFADKDNNTRGEFYKGLLQKDEKFVILGGLIDENDPPSDLFDLFVRYNKDGSLDKSWKAPVRTKTTLGYFPQTMAQNDKGDIYILYAGATAAKIDQFKVKKYNKDGYLDTRFGDGGEIAYVSPDSVANYTKMAIDTKGRIVLFAGTSGRQSQDLYTEMIRLLPNGQKDESFGNGGWVKHHFTPIDQMTCLVIDASNGIIVGGRMADTSYSSTNPPSYYAIARYKENGEPDLNFNNGLGYNRWDLGGSFSGTFTLNDIQLQGGDGGKIVGVGTFSKNPENLRSTYMWISRYTARGTIDTSFGDTGKVKAQVFYKSRFMSDGRLARIIDNGSKVLVAGSVAAYFNNERVQFYASTLTKWYLKERTIITPRLEDAAAESDAVVKPEGNTITASVRPNPTHNSATIAFNLERNSQVNVRIADINGRTVATVYSGTLNKGSQVMQADMSKLPPGMYHVILQTEMGVKTMKLMKE